MKNDSTTIEIKPAKGRPMLTWVGKKPLRHAIAYPAQLVETYNSPLLKGEGPGVRSELWNDWPKAFPHSGLLFHGDNKDVLAHLLANGFRGVVKLIYIDPPFDSGADYIRRVTLRSQNGATRLEGDGYTLGEQVQYTDIWANDNYLQFMFERLLLLKELLSEGGIFVLHCDYRKTHQLRLLLDEIFGEESFQNEVIWQKTRVSKSQSLNFGNIHDTLLFYASGKRTTFQPQFEEYSKEYVESHYNLIDENGRRYGLWDFTQAGVGPARQFGDVEISPPPGKHWIWSQDRIDKAMSEKRIEFTSSGLPRLRRYLDEAKGKQIGDLWIDIFDVNSQADERLDYPTQKPEALLERILESSTDAGDLVLDCFLGSGTTAAIAQKLGRRWIGADINKGAIQTTIKRLQGVIQEQATRVQQPPLPLGEGRGEGEIPPAQLGFSVYRVNDYDLQIQHNEAFNLAVEHLGMTRTKTDAFFDGTLGKKLVKIVPFNHPVTALDLEDVKNELDSRPDEGRDVAVVGLGKEIAVDGWLAEWNKLRVQGNLPNKIEVIELRSDPKYGGFFTHEPAQAKVSFKRVKEGVEISIEDFISPTILERLRQQNKNNPLFQPQIDDWSAMVDSVMIDNAYDGQVFNIALADVPEKKNELVKGKYVVEAAEGARVAVKVTDMLGEEVLSVWEG